MRKNGATKKLLRELSRGPATANEISLILDMERAAVAARCSELLRRGMIRAIGRKYHDGRGRPAYIWELTSPDVSGRPRGLDLERADGTSG